MRRLISFVTYFDDMGTKQKKPASVKKRALEKLSIECNLWLRDPGFFPVTRSVMMAMMPRIKTQPAAFGGKAIKESLGKSQRHNESSIIHVYQKVKPVGSGTEYGHMI